MHEGFQLYVSLCVGLGCFVILFYWGVSLRESVLERAVCEPASNR